MVALREHPAVAPRKRRELDHGGPFEIARQGVERDVSLERDAADDPVSEPDAARDDAIRSVRADERVRANSVAVHARGDTRRARLQVLHAHTFPQLRADAGGLLGEKCVQPAALRHADQGLDVATRERRPVPQSQLEPVDVTLDDRRRIHGHLLQRTARETAAARLVAREAGLLGEQHARARASEVDRRRGAGGTCADDEDVVRLHVDESRDARLQSAVPQGFPSGQRGRAVNPLAQPSEVRILSPAQGGGTAWFPRRPPPSSAAARIGPHLASRPAKPASGRDGLRTGALASFAVTLVV